MLLGDNALNGAALASPTTLSPTAFLELGNSNGKTPTPSEASSTMASSSTDPVVPSLMGTHKSSSSGPCSPRTTPFNLTLSDFGSQSGFTFGSQCFGDAVLGGLPTMTFGVNDLPSGGSSGITTRSPSVEDMLAASLLNPAFPDTHSMSQSSQTMNHQMQLQSLLQSQTTNPSSSSIPQMTDTQPNHVFGGPITMPTLDFFNNIDLNASSNMSQTQHLAALHPRTQQESSSIGNTDLSLGALHNPMDFVPNPPLRGTNVFDSFPTHIQSRSTPPERSLAMEMLTSQLLDTTVYTHALQELIGQGPASTPQAPTPTNSSSTTLPMEIKEESLTSSSFKVNTVSMLETSDTLKRAFVDPDIAEMPEPCNVKRQRLSSGDSDENNNDMPPLEVVGRQGKQKVSHNVIEKRYRNNLNDALGNLKKVVPALRLARPKSSYAKPGDSDSDSDGEADGDKVVDGIGLATKLNKGTILRKACEYIMHLKRREVWLSLENAAFRARIGGGVTPSEKSKMEEEFRTWERAWFDEMDLVLPSPKVSKTRKRRVVKKTTDEQTAPAKARKDPKRSKSATPPYSNSEGELSPGVSNSTSTSSSENSNSEESVKKEGKAQTRRQLAKTGGFAGLGAAGSFMLAGSGDVVETSIAVARFVKRSYEDVPQEAGQLSWNYMSILGIALICASVIGLLSICIANVVRRNKFKLVSGLSGWIYAVIAFLTAKRNMKHDDRLIQLKWLKDVCEERFRTKQEPLTTCQKYYLAFAFARTLQVDSQPNSGNKDDVSRLPFDILIALALHLSDKRQIRMLIGLFRQRFPDEKTLSGPLLLEDWVMSYDEIPKHITSVSDARATFMTDRDIHIYLDSTSRLLPESPLLAALAKKDLNAVIVATNDEYARLSSAFTWTTKPDKAIAIRLFTVGIMLRVVIIEHALSTIDGLEEIDKKQALQSIGTSVSALLALYIRSYRHLACVSDSPSSELLYTRTFVDQDRLVKMAFLKALSGLSSILEGKVGERCHWLLKKEIGNMLRKNDMIRTTEVVKPVKTLIRPRFS